MRRRLMSLTAALIVVLPLSVIAARWQWNRHVQRDALNAAVSQAERTAPIPWRTLDGTTSAASLEWRQVTATGHWVPSRQLLVRRQVVDGDVGFSVLTPFDAVSEGTAEPARLLVLRGWVPNTAQLSEVPVASTDTVTVTLRVREVHGEGVMRPSDLPAGQINFVDPEQFDAAWWDGRESVDAVFELLEPVPPGLTLLPWPTLSSGPHVSYFVQWILIGCTAVIVYVRVFRSELRLREQEEEAEPAT